MPGGPLGALPLRFRRMKGLAKLLRCALGQREVSLPAPPPTRMLTFSPPTASGQSLRSRDEKAEGMSFTSTTPHADASLPLPIARERSERLRDEEKRRKKGGTPGEGSPVSRPRRDSSLPLLRLGRRIRSRDAVSRSASFLKKAGPKTSSLCPRAEGSSLPGTTPHADANFLSPNRERAKRTIPRRKNATKKGATPGEGSPVSRPRRDSSLPLLRLGRRIRSRDAVSRSASFLKKAGPKTSSLCPRAEGSSLPGTTPHADANFLSPNRKRAKRTPPRRKKARRKKYLQMRGKCI